jgi:hypothetical protein
VKRPLAALGPGHASVDQTACIAATTVGRVARRALASERTWRVFAVFRRSFYCRSAGGALVLVGPETLGAGPLHVLGAQPGETGSRLLGVGTRVGVDLEDPGGDTSARLTLVLRGAREWQPPPPPRFTPSNLRRSLAWLEGAADRPPVEGVGRLIAPLAAGATGSARAPGGSILTERAWPALAALAGWVRDALVHEGAAGPPPALADGLIGLGPGLTPSGDDVLAGALLALYALDRADLAKRLAAWLRPRAEGRTGLVSLAHLECAAQGQGAAVLHEALAALSSGDAATLDRAAAALGTLGHSSGWDGLTGIVAVAVAWLGAAAADGGRSSSCR